MRILPLTLIVLCAIGSRVGAGCPADSTAAAERELRSIGAEVTRLDSTLTALEGALGKIRREIDAASEGAESNPLKRRRLEGLLGQSRTVAVRMESLAARRSSLADRRERVERWLRACYADSMEASLERLAGAIRDRRFDEARMQLGVVRALEERDSRLAGSGPSPEPREYPVISDEFVGSSLAGVGDKQFLIDTIDDLIDKAEADSMKVAGRLAEVRKSIRLKRDLVRLVNQARQGGLDRGAFFESFGREDVERDIERLEAEANALESSLAEATRAIAYYRDRKARLTRGRGGDKE